jgi:sortase A
MAVTRPHARRRTADSKGTWPARRNGGSLRRALILTGLLVLAREAAARRSNRRRESTDDRRRPDETTVVAKPAEATPPQSPPARRRSRRLGTALIVGGLLVLAYAATLVLWRDPVTDVYARAQQQRLATSLDRSFAEYREIVREDDAGAVLSMRRTATLEAKKRALRSVSTRFEARLKLGQPLGRIVVPRLDLNAVFLHGTRWAEDLSKGPGHYPETSVSGTGKTMAIAGHRTTFGAPFRHIDSLRRGDVIELRLQYGTFRYQVFAYEVVDSDDWSIIRERGFDTLVLSACHPLYSSAKRWIVYARLTTAKPAGGTEFSVASRVAPASAS